MKRLIYKLNNEFNYEELTCGNSSKHNALRLISFIAPFGIQTKLDGRFSLGKETTFFTHKETGLIILQFYTNDYDSDIYQLRLTKKNLAKLRRQCTKNNANKAPFLIITKDKSDIVTVTFSQQLYENDLKSIKQDKTIASILFGLKCTYVTLMIIALVYSIICHIYEKINL